MPILSGFYLFPMSEKPTPEEIADIKRMGDAMAAAEEACVQELQRLVDKEKQGPEVSP
ncbi:MAG: hypothetical protein KGH56_03230 [Patescibacteria group bacterium]|nr:hypothetical protein [Patescibacteria group bacterium]